MPEGESIRRIPTQPVKQAARPGPGDRGWPEPGHKMASSIAGVLWGTVTWSFMFRCCYFAWRFPPWRLGCFGGQRSRYRGHRPVAANPARPLAMGGNRHWRGPPPKPPAAPPVDPGVTGWLPATLIHASPAEGHRGTARQRRASSSPGDGDAISRPAGGPD